MGIKRIVDVSFWTDGKVDEFTPEDKYFMLYLLTNPFSSLLGIYEISIKQAAFQMGYSPETVIGLIDRFSSKYGVILFSKETNEIAIKNFLRHSIVKGGKPVADCIKRDMQAVKNKDLIRAVFEHISVKGGLNQTIQAIITGFLNGNENGNGNGYGNGNGNGYGYGVSYPVSGNDTYPDTPVKGIYGKHDNVLLTASEYVKIKTLYPDSYNQKIDRLSNYMHKSGKAYEDHFSTLLQWAKEGEKETGAGRPANPFMQMTQGGDMF